MTETQYQSALIKKLKHKFPGCVVLKNDPEEVQGIPDLTILYCDKWASLEVKVSATAPYRPNQEHYLHRMDEMSFATTIYPENEEEVLIALEQAFLS